MTANADDKRQRTVAYLKRSLQLNPLYESDQIIRHRSKALGLTQAKNLLTSSSLAARRGRLLKKIDAIRADCWTEPVEPLLAKLEALKLDDQPDLLRTAERLEIILTNRQHLPPLAQHEDFDEKFLTCFKQILTLPPRELAIPREKVVASFRNRKLRKRGMKMIELLEQEVPELCLLEQDWLDSLKRQKADRSFVLRTNDYQDYQSVPVGNESFGLSWWVLGIVVFVLLKLARAYFRFSD